MNIDFELYRVFYTVAQNKNITKASKELNISQPAISKSIKNLEQQLGGQLFIRTKQGVTLTEEGKEFYNYISQAIEYIYNAENKFIELINLETGCIKIGASATITREFLLPYIEEFHNLYPNIKIQIDTNLSSILIKKLKAGLVDIVVFNLNDKNYGNDIKITKCKKVTDCFFVGKEYKYLSEKEISIKDLNNYPLILQAKDSNTREFLDNFANEYNVVLKGNIELASFSLAVEFAKIGFGIGYSNKEYIKDSLNEGTLFELKLKEKIPTRYVGIATSINNEPNFSTKKFIEIINKNNKAL